jgi:hypothetical protein
MELNLLIKQSLMKDVGTPRKVVENQIEPGTGAVEESVVEEPEVEGETAVVEGEEADYNNPKKPEFKATEKKLADNSAKDDVDACTKATGAGPEPTVKTAKDTFHKEGMKLEDASASIYAIANGYGTLKKNLIQ